MFSTRGGLTRKLIQRLKVTFMKTAKGGTKMEKRRRRTVLRLVILSVMAVTIVSVPLGSITSLSGVASAEPPRLASNGSCAVGDVYDPICDVNRNGIINVVDIMLVASKWQQEGNWTSDANADPPCFDNSNRYVYCGNNGTVNDTVTNLIWLGNANCFGVLLDYAAANNAAAGLEDGECGLTDGSSPGDWRLPTREEWEATIERAAALGCTEANGPALTNTPGNGCYRNGPQPFTGVQSSFYWSSTSRALDTDYAWGGNLFYGFVNAALKTNPYYVWPVRGGQ